MRLLFIEDDDDLRNQLAERMRREGYVVDATASGREGEYLGVEFPIDVAIVDLGLPDVGGIEVISNWRKQGIGFPVLILTARGRWQDKVEGLEAGADDFLVKPFQPEELSARLRALLRRASGWSDSRLRCPPLVLDLSAKSVSVADRAVPVTALEYKVLEYLMLHTGSVVSKARLSEHIYDDEADCDSNVLEVIVGRLRRKLDPDRTIDPIETLRGQGYRFRLPRTDDDASTRTEAESQTGA